MFFSGTDVDKDATGQGQKAAASTWAETKPVNPSKKMQSEKSRCLQLIADEEQVGATRWRWDWFLHGCDWFLSGCDWGLLTTVVWIQSFQSY